MNHSGHFIKKCSNCGTVIMQCRCMDPDKPIVYGICLKCSSQEKGTYEKGKRD